jgi:hypothetical protein
MILYIYLLFHEIVINCTQSIGCIQTSYAHFDFMMKAGMLELIFEIPKVVQIFSKKEKKEDAIETR